MQLKNIRKPFKSELAKVDAFVIEKLHSNVKLINQLGEYIVDSGGKRLRPLLVLLSADAAGYQGDSHIALAAIVEFIHTATLLHDDVVDASLLRRGHDTANAIFGDKASVLVGDFLYSRAFQMLVEIGDMQIMQLFADTTNTIAEGEVLQLSFSDECKLSEHDYYKVIESKTAILFACAAKLGGMLARLETAHCNALYNFGLKMGLAYQIVDDALDYKGNQKKIGKNLGDDLNEGKITLPILYALQTAENTTKKWLKKTLKAKDISKLSEIQQVILETGALDKTMFTAKQIKQQALESLNKVNWPASTVHLQEIAEFAIMRDF